MRRPLVGMLFTLAACLILVPASTLATPKIGAKDNGFSVSDERYLSTYIDCWHAFKAQCGRNIVDDGLANGNEPTQGKVEASTATMDRWLSPEPTASVSPATTSQVAPAPATTSVAPSSAAPSTVQCESSGNYAANTGNGYYGGYQFDSGTWDAYGDPAYGEASDAPPAVQDAAAASVPYDAWPNC